MITGKAVVYGVKDKRAMNDKELKDKIFHVPLTNNISGFSLPEEDVEDDKAAVAEMRKYEKEKANELENNIAKYQKLVGDKEKEILAKSPKSSQLSEQDKINRDNIFKKYINDEIKEQKDLILSGYNEKVVAEARKRKAELEELKSAATDEQKNQFLEEYKNELEKRLLIPRLQSYVKNIIN